MVSRLACLVAAAAIGAACLGDVSPRYLVTAAPVDVGRGIEQCIALELGAVDRVWWWGPGRTGCATRSTGPGLFPISDAEITRRPDGSAATISYDVPLIPAGELPVVLVLDGSMVHAAAVGKAVRLEPATTLEVPELPPFGRP